MKRKCPACGRSIGLVLSAEENLRCPQCDVLLSKRHSTFGQIIIGAVIGGAIVAIAIIGLGLGATVAVLCGLIAWGYFLSFFTRYVICAPPDTPCCHNCSYDLRGSISAGQLTCPECGHVIVKTSTETD